MSKSSILKDLTPQRALSVAIIVAVIVAVVWLFWGKIASAIRGAIAQKKLENEAGQYGQQTLTDSQIRSLAEQIYTAMKGWGTDESAIEYVLTQIKSNADWAALRTAYAAVNKDTTYTTLDSRIAYEGTNRELARWRAILDSNGVTIYTF